jgi:hypothetical protein
MAEAQTRDLPTLMPYWREVLLNIEWLYYIDLIYIYRGVLAQP